MVDALTVLVLFSLKALTFSDMPLVPFFKTVVLVMVVFLLSSCGGRLSVEELAAKQARQDMLGFYAAPRSSFLPAVPSAEIRQRSVVFPKDRKGYPTYPDHYRHRFVRSTAYSDAENEPGAYLNYNAAGTRLQYTSFVRSAAADWSVYPMGTKFKIKGLPYTYIVDDYGSALVGSNTIDIYHPTLRSMKKWATRPIEIHVIQWGSWEESARLLKGRVRHGHCRKMYNGIKRKISIGLSQPMTY